MEDVQFRSSLNHAKMVPESFVRANRSSHVFENMRCSMLILAAPTLEKSNVPSEHTRRSPPAATEQKSFGLPEVRWSGAGLRWLWEGRVSFWHGD